MLLKVVNLRFLVSPHSTPNADNVNPQGRDLVVVKRCPGVTSFSKLTRCRDEGPSAIVLFIEQCFTQ